MAITEMQEEYDEFEDEVVVDDVEVEADAEEEVEIEPEEVEVEPDPDPDPKPEDDSEDYGKRVKKRISKLTYRAKSAEEKAAEIERENLRLKQELDELQVTSVNNSLSHLEAQQAAAKDRLRQALDEGDASEAAEAQAELSTLSAEVTYMKRAAKPQKVQQAASQPAPEQAPAARAWVEENQAWFDKPEYAPYRSAAASIEQALVAEGYDYDEDLYEELDVRLAEVMPGISKVRGDQKTKATEESKEEESSRGHQQVVSQGRSGAGVRRKQGDGKRLTQADLKTMSRYGFDPDSPADRKAWLNRNKL